ncbi:MAG: hypothetical protein ACI9J3_001806 [Parvicellaceae bacterium]|jgi:hypothetical protein
MNIKSILIVFGVLSVIVSCTNDSGVHAPVANEEIEESDIIPTLVDSIKPLFGLWQLAIKEESGWKKVISEQHFGIEFSNSMGRPKTPRIILTTLYGISENHEILNINWLTDTSFVLNCNKDDGVEAILHPTWAGDNIPVIEIINSNKIQDLFQEMTGNGSTLYKMIFYQSISGKRPSFLDPKDKIAVDYSLELNS